MTRPPAGVPRPFRSARGVRRREAPDQQGQPPAVGLLLALPAFAGARAETWFMLCVAVVPLGDMLIVLRHGSTTAVALGIHFATAAVILISAGLLFLV
ncbi:DUF4267 domain-containing protein [Streptomyces sp. b94]|uniref:DUF4267 domain-containing protein n=1 Tax=Streptomyces sp. b94 TaxID=1827634 RepID=UPI0035ABB1D6